MSFFDKFCKLIGVDDSEPVKPIGCFWKSEPAKTVTQSFVPPTAVPQTAAQKSIMTSQVSEYNTKLRCPYCGKNTINLVRNNTIYYCVTCQKYIPRDYPNLSETTPKIAPLPPQTMPPKKCPKCGTMSEYMTKYKVYNCKKCKVAFK